MPAAGMLHDRARFDQRVEGADDGHGNTLSTWTAIVTRWVSYRPDFGNESEQAGRLESTMRGTLKVRRDSVTETITAAARVVFVAGHYTGREAQIRAIKPTPDGADIEMTLEFGVAV
jgi:head-tail adaptor